MDEKHDFLHEIEHGQIFSSKQMYCGHPRCGGIRYFGGGEIAVIYRRAPCDYSTLQSVNHNLYQKRGHVILQRSLDGGHSWPEELTVVVVDNTIPDKIRKTELAAGALRRDIDLSSPDTMYHFDFAELESDFLCYFIRSVDRGKTWDTGASIIPKRTGHQWVFTQNHPIVRMPDDTYLQGFSLQRPGGIVGLYGTDDNGVTWDYLGLIAHDPTGLGRPTYPSLLFLPGGRLQCYTVNIGGIRNAIQIQESVDGGYSWTEPRPIVRWGASPWASRPRKEPGSYSLGQFHYRSPWPIILKDGRILVVFARRKPPFGIGAILSEDQGKSWSREAIIRDDAACSDIGYPVAVQLEDGTLFTAYYYVTEMGGYYGGPRFIATSRFRVK